MAINQQQIAKIKGVTDVVFCIDRSKSMHPCIEGLKKTINTFIHSVETTNESVEVDWRIGFLAYDDKKFYQFDLTDKIEDFTSKLSEIVTGGNEYTPGALDYLINSFQWRQEANRTIILFTNESFKGGILKGLDPGKWDNLLQRIMEMKIRVKYFGPECPYYRKFEQTPRCNTTIVKDFSTVDFTSLMKLLGSTVSQASTQGSPNIEGGNHLYDLSDISIIKI